jgi:hypothetical protein
LCDGVCLPAHSRVILGGMPALQLWQSGRLIAAGVATLTPELLNAKLPPRTVAWLVRHEAGTDLDGCLRCVAGVLRLAVLPRRGAPVGCLCHLAYGCSHADLSTACLGEALLWVVYAILPMAAAM